MRTGASGRLVGVVLVAFACSDSVRVESPAAIPPSSGDGPAAVADDPHPSEPERPATEAEDPRLPEPRQRVVDVETRDDSAFEVADPIAARLDDAMVRGDDEAVEQAMMELEDRGGSGAIDALGAVLESHPDADIRLDALGSIAVISDTGTVPPALVAALVDPHPDVRMEAIDLISDSGDLSMLSVLERYSAAEREEEVRAVYDDAIEELRDAYNDAIEDLRDSRFDD